MLDYEKLGAFYLGKVYNANEKRLTDEIVLYDSKDLTTHAVIIGMTGSGKTGLAIGLIEEALIDSIPVIAIDPKGDLPNLLLTFPSLKGSDFLPWIDEQNAVKNGLTPEQHAEKQAATWKKGLADWGQSPERIARLRESADFAVYTPGSNAGFPVSVLRNFNPPSPAVFQDTDLLRERIQNTATSLLSLLNIDADPISSREHILLSNIFGTLWASGKGVDLAGLIHAIQAPPFERVGIMDLESFYPSKERFNLAMRLNSLLAAPGFETWMEGAPLDIGNFLYTSSGKPRASIFTISHLPDNERMFFVSMLLNEILNWMRTQPGTPSLRALLYMDEIFGYFPPVKNPPSKAPLLALLKQARAFGLGVVLATQNPVDLDYKGLSNTGTWFLGRLQTEQDKARVLDGLQGASGTAFGRSQMENLLSGLGERIFLLHNVHDNVPIVFQSRWVLSYLRGPMTRQQIKALTQHLPETSPSQASTLAIRPGSAASSTPSAPAQSQAFNAPPVLPPEIPVFFLPASGAGQGLVYHPAFIGQAQVHYSSPKHNLYADEAVFLAVELCEGPVLVDWNQSMELSFDPSGLQNQPLAGAVFSDIPSPGKDPMIFRRMSKEWIQWVRQNRPMVLYHSRIYNEISRPGESESQFRARLSQKLREKRDLEVEKIRKKYASKFTTLKNRSLRAEQAVEREKDQAKSKKVETAISFGSAILGALLGRKAVSSTSTYRVGTAMKSASRIGKEQMDVARATETAQTIQRELEELEARLQEDIAALETSFDPAAQEIEEMRLNTAGTDIHLKVFGLGWLPYRPGASGGMIPDWR